jgi:hypothetical protein
LVKTALDYPDIWIHSTEGCCVAGQAIGGVQVKKFSVCAVGEGSLTRERASSSLGRTISITVRSIQHIAVGKGIEASLDNARGWV